MGVVDLGPVSWERMTRAVADSRDRLLRATAALERANVPYAVVGGHAVAAWVSRVDEGAVRTTRDVDLLLRRVDLEAAKTAFASEGFVYRHVAGMDRFVDGGRPSARDAVHVLFAGEKVRAEYAHEAPLVSDAEKAEHFRVVSLGALVRMKLTSHRLKDRVHLLDMIDVGLIDRAWCDHLPDDLAERLRFLLDHPEA